MPVPLFSFTVYSVCAVSFWCVCWYFWVYVPLPLLPLVRYPGTSFLFHCVLAVVFPVTVRAELFTLAVKVFPVCASQT